MLKKLGNSFQIAIPKKIVTYLHLSPEDYIDIHVEGNRIVLEPQTVIPKDQAYFHTPEWQKDEQQAQKDIDQKKTTASGDINDLIRKIQNPNQESK